MKKAFISISIFLLAAGCNRSAMVNRTESAAKVTYSSYSDQSYLFTIEYPSNWRMYNLSHEDSGQTTHLGFAVPDEVIITGEPKPSALDVINNKVYPYGEYALILHVGQEQQDSDPKTWIGSLFLDTRLKPLPKEEIEEQEKLTIGDIVYTKYHLITRNKDFYLTKRKKYNPGDYIGFEYNEKHKEEALKVVESFESCCAYSPLDSSQTTRGN